MNLREIQLSARVLLIIEFVTVGVILLLLVIVLFKSSGGVVDSRQLTFNAFNATTILAGASFAAFSIAGFDHSATLGREAKDPARAISLAVVGSVAACGVLFVVAT